MAVATAASEVRPKVRVLPETGANAFDDLDKAARSGVIGVCQRCCPPISCGVSDFRGADFVFWVQPDGSCGLPVSGFS